MKMRTIRVTFVIVVFEICSKTPKIITGPQWQKNLLDCLLKKDQHRLGRLGEVFPGVLPVDVLVFALNNNVVKLVYGSNFKEFGTHLFI